MNRPLINVRTDPTVRDQLQAIAQADGLTLSDVCRRAFANEIRRHERRQRKDGTP